MPTDWGHPRRILFRFGSIYFFLYFLVVPLTELSGLQVVPYVRTLIRPLIAMESWYEDGVNRAVVWFAQTVLRLPPGTVVIQPTGSGDTALNYVQTALFIAIALAGTLLWSAADRSRPSYPRLAEFLRVYMRYALASIMLGYGLAKIPPVQFRPPTPDRLIRTFGQASPMGLLWTFMGFSPAYQMFGGLAEAVGALLLLWRRTATLGAIVLAGVLLNVVMLNFCYDVPVKLYSSHLLLACLILLLPAYPRLMSVLLLNRPTEPAILYRPLSTPWKNRALRIAKALVVSIMLGTAGWGAALGWASLNRPKPPLNGLYEVESFALDGEVRPPLTTDPQRWRRFAVNQFGNAYIQDMSDKLERFAATHDEPARMLTLRPGGADTREFVLSCSPEGQDRLVLDGPFRDGRVHIVLNRLPDSAMTLTGRGFHWIQELPFNR